MKTIHYLLFLFFLNSSVFGQGTKKHVVYFETDNSELTQNEKERLTGFFNLFDKSKITDITLKGHTDSDGEDKYNDRLSANRSKVVSRNLLLHGLRSTKAESFGEKKPVNTNASDNEKARNRRVEVLVSYSKGGLLTHNDFKVLAFRNLPTSEFCIDPTKDTILNLPRGGRVLFDANTFPSDGKCVKISAKEAYKRSEIVLANLGTTSNSDLLESGGMIFLEAKNSSDQILDAQKDFTVQIPTKKPLKDMMIFNGEHLSDSAVNWIQNRNNVSWTPDDLLMGCFNPERRIIPGPTACEECRFFFCRIKRFPKPFKGMVNADVRSDNRTLRLCQRRIRRARRSGERVGTNNTDVPVYPSEPRSQFCEDIASIMDSLGFENYNEYYNWRMEKEKANMLEALKADNVSVGNVVYYSMRSNRMGWINCDRFVSMPVDQKIAPIIIANEDESQLENTQCSIVLEDRTSVIASRKDGKKFSFIGLPKKMAVFVIAVMMRKGKIFLSMERTEIQANMPTFNFKEVTYDELEKALAKLD